MQRRNSADIIQHENQNSELCRGKKLPGSLTSSSDFLIMSDHVYSYFPRLPSLCYLSAVIHSVLLHNLNQI